MNVKVNHVSLKCESESHLCEALRIKNERKDENEKVDVKIDCFAVEVSCVNLFMRIRMLPLIHQTKDEAVEDQGFVKRWFLKSRSPQEQ